MSMFLSQGLDTDTAISTLTAVGSWITSNSVLVAFLALALVSAGVKVFLKVFASVKSKA